MEKTISQQLGEQANIVPTLQLGTKQQGGGVKSTGRHFVKFISDKVVKGTEYMTGKEIQVVKYIFEENGTQKQYKVPVKSKTGELHYFIQRMMDCQIGEEIILEMKSERGKNFISFERVIQGKPEKPLISEDEIPVIEDEVVHKKVPTMEGNEIDAEDINPENIPF